MAQTIDAALERKRDEHALEQGLKPELAPGKKTPDIRGPRGADEPGFGALDDADEDDGRGRD
jgi:hypothetical protein